MCFYNAGLRSSKHGFFPVLGRQWLTYIKRQLVPTVVDFTHPLRSAPQSGLHACRVYIRTRQPKPVESD